jgi:hypothetical protein
MGYRSFLARPFARYIASKVKTMQENAVSDQMKIFNKIVSTAKETAFGKDHQFGAIKSYKDFKAAVPIRDYEGLKSYFDRIVEGESDVLWPGRPRFFAKTSGTTSGVKYIPLTNESLPNHFGTARDASFNYAYKTGDFSFMDGKIIFLSGSPVMDDTNGIPTGRLSGISNLLVPAWLKSNQMPTFKTNCIEDWEPKVSKIVDETLLEDMRMISGIPPWVQMYFEKLLEKSGKSNVSEVFPNFNLFIYGGVNYEPYRAKIERLIGKRVHALELYPASEGFIAFQSDPDDPSLLLNTNSGIFFEFIPASEYFDENPTRLTVEQVQTGVSYALVINSNAGLWGYSIGDTVEFTSLNPYKLRVSGRIKHYISAFGEHVIGKEVDDAMLEVSRAMNINITEFTVAPQVNPDSGLPYHEWLVEFDTQPEDMDAFAAALDTSMCRQNIYYQDLIKGHILRPLVLTPLKPGSFIEYMKSEGKLGGQNKVPRLSNDRKIADRLVTLAVGLTS